MTIALLAILLAQVGVGIDRPPVTAAGKHVPARRVPAPRMTASPAPSTTAPDAGLCKHAADPAIDSATEEKIDTSGGTDDYVIHVSILNRGAAAQRPAAKQLISVYRNEERIARKQIPSLEAGEAYAFTTKFKRSSEAGTNSTTLLFRLGGENYAPRSLEDCNDRNNSFRLTF